MELDILLVSAAFKLAILFAAVEYGLFTLRRLDKRVGFEWRQRIAPRLSTCPIGAGIYFGLRFLGLILGIAITLS